MYGQLPNAQNFPLFRTVHQYSIINHYEHNERVINEQEMLEAALLYLYKTEEVRIIHNK